MTCYDVEKAIATAEEEVRDIVRALNRIPEMEALGGSFNPSKMGPRIWIHCHSIRTLNRFMWAFCRKSGYGRISCDKFRDEKWRLVVENIATDAVAKYMRFVLEGAPNTTKDECDKLARGIDEWLDGDSPWCLDKWHDNSMDKGTFTDPRDGKVYKTVKIGKQVWLAENLNWEDAGVCYNNDPAMGAKYGRLYTWDEATKAALPGWHLPTKDEWETLTDYAGTFLRAGTALKSEKRVGLDGIRDGWDGTDAFGFSALPGGDRWHDGDFGNVGEIGYWWGATEKDSEVYIYAMIIEGNTASGLCTRNKNGSVSVRLVQD